jgi:ATP-dependent protease HslVU (ClpYQ) peptidase subunit
MTCIVGIRHEGEVFIGGDALGSTHYRKAVRSDGKIFRNGPFVMGFTSSYRMGQLLRYAFKPPVIGDDIDQYMVVDFVDAVRKCLREGGWQQTDDGQDVGGSFLVGYQDRLFAIHSDYQVASNDCGYDAVGSGEAFAMGSLFSTEGLDPKARIRTAIKAATFSSPSVGGPVTILKTKGKK